MRISVNGGHTPAAPGASRFIDEVTEDRKVKDALINEFKTRGHSASDSTADSYMGASEDLVTQCIRANASGAELGVSIHFNAGGGTGVEVLYHPSDSIGKMYAEKVSASLAATLGLPNRGAKSRSDLYWLNNTNMTAILVEVCFVDSQADSNAYKRVGHSAVASAIARAIVGGTVNSGGAKWIQETTGKKRWWYRHADGSYTKNGWEKIGGMWYLFDKNGWMRTGWVTWKNEKYYLQPTSTKDFKEGQMRTGWVKLSGVWYYFESDGSMVKSECRKIDGKWYAFDSKGKMKTAVKVSTSGSLVL